MKKHVDPPTVDDATVSLQGCTSIAGDELVIAGDEVVITGDESLIAGDEWG